jgi:glycosyltransferase involved in cell wall biosynthesis
MRRVAIIGPDFCPSSLPPALRIRFFAQHLPEFGWEPIVITTDPHFYEAPVDEENERLLPPGLRVIRTAAWSAKSSRSFGIGDLGLRTIGYQWNALKRLAEQERIDLLFLPVPPYYPILLGRLAFRRLGLPYVVDFIDPWVSNHSFSVPRTQRPPKWLFAHWLARALEPIALRDVSEIVAVSQGTVEGVFRRYQWLQGKTATEIPYGGEPSDFSYVRQHRRPNRFFLPHDGLLHVGYIGAFTEAMRPIVRALFAAVKLGRESNPTLFGRVRLHFIGTSYGATQQKKVEPIAEEIGIGDVVRESPDRIDYLEALSLLLDCHMLLVIGSEEAHYSASKVFPYVLSRRPVFSLLHERSNVVPILRDVQAGEVLTFATAAELATQTDAVMAALERLLRLPPGAEPTTRWDRFEQYTTRAMTQRLATVLDRATAGSDSGTEVVSASAAR